MWLGRRKTTRPLPPLASVDQIIAQLEVELARAHLLVQELRLRSKVVEGDELRESKRV